MSRSLPSLPDLPNPLHREREKHRWRKALPFLALGLLVAVVFAKWSKSRSGAASQRQDGTAPAGIPPMPPRPAPPFDAPPPTAVATQPEPAAAPAPAAAAELPEPIEAADGLGIASPEALSEAGPDLANWLGALESDIAAASREEASDATTARADDTEGATDPGADGAVAGDASAVERGWIEVADLAECPDGFPIKGNASSRIYHRPGESSYEATMPEICFASEEVAANLGYRARKR